MTPEPFDPDHARDALVRGVLVGLSISAAGYLAAAAYLMLP